MAAPKVQALNDIISSLNPAFQADRSLIATQQKGLNNKYGSQRTALDASKVQGFNDINTQAVGKGLAFSGIPVSEQANYLSTKYLPGMQALNEQQNTESMGLQSALNAINKEQRLKALDTRQTQQSALQTYLENERQRQFTAQQNALERAASAANSAAGRQADMVDPNSAATAILQAGAGNDGYVSPNAFRDARLAYIQAGGDNKSFMDQFWRYTGAGNGQKNQNNWQSYYYGK